MKPPIILLTIFCIALAGCLTASASNEQNFYEQPDNSCNGNCYGECHNCGTCDSNNCGLGSSCPDGSCSISCSKEYYRMHHPDRNYNSYPEGSYRHKGNCRDHCFDGNCGAEKEPATTEPVTVTKPVPSEPVKPTEPVPSEPVKSTEPVTTEPVKPIEPVTTEPVRPTEPVPSEPVKSTEPVTTEPVKPIEPVPSEPVKSTKPAPSKPENTPSTNGKTTYELCSNNVCNIGGDGKVLTLTNYDNAKDPTYDQLIAFLKEDKTDEKSYTSGYVCSDFARTLHNNAEENGIKCAFVGCDFTRGVGHAFNKFQTTDKGNVYIDCTGVPGGSTYEDKILKCAVGQFLTSQYLFKEGNLDSMGIVKELQVFT